MEIDFLKKRAEGFLRDAEFAISEKRWFSAAFHLEQACQLYLKYFLFKKIKDFPKTHSLKRLLEAIGEAYSQKKKVKDFLKKEKKVIHDLEQAYLTSRYLPIDFLEEDVLKMKKFTQRLIKFLNSL